MLFCIDNYLKGGGAVKRKLLEYIVQLQKALEEEMKNSNVATSKELLPASLTIADNLQCFVRVNEIKMQLADGLKELQKVSSIAKLDVDIPSLIVLPSSIPGLGSHPLVQNGCLIIQDKASCLPSQLLFDQWTSGDIIDACAAPGNKTSHLAALVFRSPSHKVNPVTITAFDRDLVRAELLLNRMRQSGADHVVSVVNGDFLVTDTSKYQGVTSILVDPSCSGSGVIRDVTRVLERQDIPVDKKRLKTLQEFQISAVLKAMSFPNVVNVVYSTCSIHQVGHANTLLCNSV